MRRRTVGPFHFLVAAAAAERESEKAPGEAVFLAENAHRQAGRRTEQSYACQRAGRPAGWLAHESRRLIGRRPRERPRGRQRARRVASAPSNRKTKLHGNEPR